jgi:ABC-type spermidine/putrescine transport system permease subunit I
VVADNKLMAKLVLLEAMVRALLAALVAPLMALAAMVAMVVLVLAGVHQTFQDPQQYTELKPLQSMSQYLSLFTKTFWKIFTKTL